MLGKIAAALMTALVLLLTGLPAKAADNADGDIVYTVINGEVTVIGFTGEPEVLEIPSEIEGFPVTEMRDNAFFTCSSLREIVLPESMTKMGHHCFYACTSLEKVTLPTVLRELGMGSFCGCVSLEEISLPESLDVLTDSCFRSCTSLRSVIVPGSVKTIEKYCFSGCTSLESVTLPEKLSGIGCRAFYMCSSLGGLYIPPSVVSIGAEAAGFVPEPSGAQPPSAKGFTVYGERGTAAEEYAKKSGIGFSEAAQAAQAMAFLENSVTSEKPLFPKIMVCVMFALLILLAALFFRQEDQS